MPKLSVTGGATSFIDEIILEDDSVSTGVGKTGVAFGDAGMSWYYKKQGDAAYTQITLATATEGTYTSGGFIESDSTNAPGSYEVGIPNAAIADGFGVVTFYLFDSGGGFRPVRWQYVESLSAADVESECNDALVALKLDHLVAVADADDPADNSIVAKMFASDGNWSGADPATDSGEAIRDLIGASVGADISADIAAVKAETADILTDTADMQPKLGAPAGADMSTDIAANQTDLNTIITDTNELQTDWADGGRLDLLLDKTVALFTTAITESYSSDGSAATPAQALYVIMQMLTEKNVSGTTVTIKKLDGSTTAMTLTLDDATTPTSITRAS